ncbi:amidohydrolase family protein [Clostridium bovifaecis]|uniref:Amidohydrolase family protein n=1 Tax=Clostridium bovifaecis TaxID=2184719 RepID=A0A6I6ER49_9CLOT|nr:amidohydrolase family protein [Clostridium bovifaecis]
MSKLIKNGNVYDVYSGSFSRKDVLIREDKIEKIAEDIIDSSADIIDAKGKNIFPGFIDAHSHLGMWTEVKNGNDANECVNPVTPNMRAIDGLNPLDKSFNEVIEEGFTTIMITPGSGNVICGQAAIIKTSGKTIGEKLINGYAAMKIALGENPKSVYSVIKKSPSSRMATASIMEENLIKGKKYYELRKNNLIEKDISLEPYIPVFNGDSPLKIHCHRADDICTAIRIVSGFGLKYTLDHCTEGYLVKEYVRDTNMPVMIGPMFMFRSKIELSNSTIDNLIILNEMGCNISFVSDHPFCNCKYLVKLLGLATKRGLSYKDAMKMITINPAKAINIDHRAGSLEEGKDADIVIYDGNPLEGNTKNLMTIVNGKVIYKNKYFKN